MSERSENLRPVYFQPGELVFHAYGDLRDIPGITEELISWAEEVAAQGISGEITISASDDIFAFNPVDKLDPEKRRTLYQRRLAVSKRQAEQREVGSEPETRYEPPPLRIPPPFSLVFARVEKQGWPEFLTDSNRIETDADAREQADALNELLDLAILLDNRRDEAPVKLEVVSLNWLMSGSPSTPGGTGGPGGYPSHVDQSDTNNYHISPKPTQNAVLPNSFDIVSQPDSGDGVVVAILDTAYKTEQLEDFYKTWVRDRPNESHPILKALLSNDSAHPGALREPNGQIRVHLDPAVDNYLPGLMIDGHYDYDMTDHGLFVAGIINSLAPKAEIHLYQVLNKYGLGDLRSIARALQQVIDDFGDKQLVVNMSLTMNLPLEERHLKATDRFRLGRAFLKQRPWWLALLVTRLFNWLFKKEHLCCCDLWFERQARAFEWICDLVYSLDSRVIAAAGNQSKSRDQRPGALYPAAFDRVFGVGALAEKTGSVVTASYSNLADKPTSKGITTFGGEPGEGKGILGVYVGQFPDGRPNENGWAWWCGTSFATPIISGIAAAVGSSMAPGTIIEEAILTLFDAQTLTTDQDEDVFTIKQGPLSS